MKAVVFVVAMYEILEYKLLNFKPTMSNNSYNQLT